MSLENAKKLVETLEGNPELKASFQADPRAALAAGNYGCTFDELKEATEAALLSREIDENELTAISGGGEACPSVIFGMGHGGCEADYFVESCAATVEDGSRCGSNDRCSVWDVTYTTAECSEISNRNDQIVNIYI